MDSTREELPRIVLKFANTEDRQAFFDRMIGGLIGVKPAPTDATAWRLVQSWDLGEGSR